MASIERHETLPTKQVVRCVRQDRSSQEYFLYIPGSGGSEAPLFVAVHGISRNAYQQACTFSAFCEEYGVVMAVPLFGEEARDYQRLGRSGRGPRADAALDAVVEEVAARTGSAATPFYLFGHSGGAQFAHRYAMAYPHRVASVAFAGSGWYTFPTRRERFPYGTRRSPDLADVRFDPDEFLRVPMTVIVGERDTETVNLRCTERVNRQQGKTRVERARRWAEAMREAARARHLEPLVSLQTIPEGDHDFMNLMMTGRLGERVFAALFGTPFERAVGRHA